MSNQSQLLPHKPFFHSNFPLSFIVSPASAVSLKTSWLFSLCSCHVQLILVNVFSNGSKLILSFLPTVAIHIHLLNCHNLLLASLIPVCFQLQFVLCLVPYYSSYWMTLKMSPLYARISGASFCLWKQALNSPAPRWKCLISWFYLSYLISHHSSSETQCLLRLFCTVPHTSLLVFAYSILPGDNPHFSLVVQTPYTKLFTAQLKSSLFQEAGPD